MDKLHGMLRTLQPERKSDSGKTSDHLSVFREFLSHLDRISKQASRPPRAKAARTVKRRTKR